MLVEVGRHDNAPANYSPVDAEHSLLLRTNPSVRHAKSAINRRLHARHARCPWDDQIRFAGSLETLRQATGERRLERAVGCLMEGVAS
jgi:hypothetical protein